jgi:dTDP-glucose 4,6-dehydratase
MIRNALAGQPLPVYGKGENVRDWLYVLDHCDAIRLVLERGRPGERYNIGGGAEKTNIEVVRAVCAILDELRPRPQGRHEERIVFVQDRPGHDLRYAIDAGKIRRELDWKPREGFESGLKKTVAWYLANQEWVQQVTSGEYRRHQQANYIARGGSYADYLPPDTYADHVPRGGS